MELTLALQVQEFHALPYAGGILDQPAGLMERMTYALKIFEAWSSWLNRKGGFESAWITEHPGWWKIVQETMENGK